MNKLWTLSRYKSFSPEKHHRSNNQKELIQDMAVDSTCKNPLHQKAKVKNHIIKQTDIDKIDKTPIQI